MTIITAAEIQKGDLIRVTRTDQYEDRKSTRIYEGVASYEDRTFNGKPVWRTEKRNNFWVHEEGAVIELLDRPKPKIELPTGEGAVIIFNKTNTSFEKRRVAVLDGRGYWQSHYPDGEWRDARTTERLIQWFEDGHATDLKVLFEGVAK